MSSLDSSRTLFHVSHLTKHYGPITALTGVSFSVRRGEVLGLLGPNGSGKTTLFECLGGVLPLDEGMVLGGDGQPLGNRDRTSLLFYLPDAIAPWPAQSVHWILDFTQGFFGGSMSMRDDVIDHLDLQPLLRSQMGELSKGQRKRALLAIGLLAPHPVLLADEPFDGLDLRQSRHVARVLRSYAGAGRTMVFSIHQISDAARVCDRFVLLSGGRVCAEGTLKELSQRAAVHGAAVANTDLEELFLALT
jgi:ABC-2 type transport system ATP-binding protein